VRRHWIVALAVASILSPLSL